MDYRKKYRNNFRSYWYKIDSCKENTSLLEEYFKTNNLSINPTKTHYILFQNQCRQKNELKILIKNCEIVNVKSTNFLSVIIDSK
jgi:hypothetical protein